jgi:hypothetical protein
MHSGTRITTVRQRGSTHRLSVWRPRPMEEGIGSPKRMAWYSPSEMHRNQTNWSGAQRRPDPDFGSYDQGVGVVGLVGLDFSHGYIPS